VCITQEFENILVSTRRVKIISYSFGMGFSLYPIFQIESRIKHYPLPPPKKSPPRKF
jgi:hypothetical protein